MIWTPDNVRRIILDTAGRLRQTPHAGLPARAEAGQDLYRDLGLDSLERLDLAAHLNEFFGIFHTSADNYLLADTALDHWTACILRARAESDEWLTFRTSGTSGAARPIRHALASLRAEARFLAQLLPRPTQVVSTVGAQHLYGFIFTILLPAVWQCPLRVLAEVSASDLNAGTLVVATPFTWEFITRSLLSAGAVRCQGVTSTAPMPPGQFAALIRSGVALTEIYGASDTGGLAYRSAPEVPFTLYPYLRLHPGEPLTAERTDTGERYPIPDRLERLSEREVRLLGRLDESVSIAGVNVYPAHVRRVIADCPLVADCDVYAKAEAGVSQLYAAVRLRTLTDANREACLHWLRERLSAPEVPRNLYVY